MDVVLRKVTVEDMEDVHQLVIGLAIYENEPEAVTATLDDYKAAFEEGIFDAIVAILDSKIVGMVLYYMTFSTWKGKCMYLEDFYVVPEYRNMGIGQQLFQAYIDETKKAGAKQAKWQILDWNEPALGFYHKNEANKKKNLWNGKLYF